jgi:hypothetical protein
MAEVGYAPSPLASCSWFLVLLPSSPLIHFCLILILVRVLVLSTSNAPLTGSSSQSGTPANALSVPQKNKTRTTVRPPRTNRRAAHPESGLSLSALASPRFSPSRLRPICCQLLSTSLSLYLPGWPLAVSSNLFASVFLFCLVRFPINHSFGHEYLKWIFRDCRRASTLRNWTVTVFCLARARDTFLYTYISRLIYNWTFVCCWPSNLPLRHGRRRIRRDFALLGHGIADFDLGPGPIGTSPQAKGTP